MEVSIQPDLASFLHEAEVPPRKTHTLGRLMVSLIVVIAAAAGLSVTYFFGFRALAFQSTSVGSCFRLDVTACTDLNPSYISNLTDIELPDGLEVLQSGTSNGFDDWRMSALIRLPDRQRVSPPDSYDDISVSDILPGPAETLKDHGIEQILWSGERRYQGQIQIVTEGIDDQGRTLLYIRVNQQR